MLSSFWSRWLLVVPLAITALGAVLACAAVPGLEGPTLALLALMHGQTPPLDETLRFSIGLMGAVTFGWGLTLMAIVRAATAHPGLSAALWRPVTASLALWWLVDSAISVSTGFALNAVSNTLLLAAWILPLQASGLLRRPA